MTIGELGATARGFAIRTFKDYYDYECRIQKSSIAEPACIWLGVVDAKPQILASQAAAYGVETTQTTGWVPYPIPSDVLLTTQMHLTREQARELAEVLLDFADIGELS